MAKDGVSTFLQDTFLEIVKERLEKAETVEEAKEITKKLEKIDLSDLFREMFFKMADDTTQYMRETMFEEVMAFRAEEDEFIIKQEQKWYGYLWWIVDENKHIYSAIGNSGNVIYVNPSNNIVIAITSYFKPTIFDRIDFVQKYVEPVISI